MKIGTWLSLEPVSAAKQNRLETRPAAREAGFPFAQVMASYDLLEERGPSVV
jgi:hypothetical protein